MRFTQNVEKIILNTQNFNSEKYLRLWICKSGYFTHFLRGGVSLNCKKLDFSCIPNDAFSLTPEQANLRNQLYNIPFAEFRIEIKFYLIPTVKMVFKFMAC